MHDVATETETELERVFDDGRRDELDRHTVAELTSLATALGHVVGSRPIKSTLLQVILSDRSFDTTAKQLNYVRNLESRRRIPFDATRRLSKPSARRRLDSAGSGTG